MRISRKITFVNGIIVVYLTRSAKSAYKAAPAEAATRKNSRRW